MEQELIRQLIDKCRQGDANAFASIVREYQPLVYKLSFRMFYSEDEAKDMTQETFVKVWLSIAGYDTKYKFSTWLYRIACNVCYDRLRVLRRSPERNMTDIDFSGLNAIPDVDVESELDNQEFKKLVLLLTEELTPKQKMVFILQDIEELDVTEIKIITGLSREKIKSNLYLARKNIRNKLKSKL